MRCAASRTRRSYLRSTPMRKQERTTRSKGAPPRLRTYSVWCAERHRCSSDRGTGSIDGTAERAPRCLRRSPAKPLAGDNSLRSSTMRKILGTAVLAIPLMGGASVVLAQSSRDLTEPTGTEANRVKTQTGDAYYGRGYRSYAYVPRLHRRWHWSHRRW